MCILSLQRGRFVYFGLVEFHNELCASHTQKHICYIHAQHWMTEAARQARGKWRMLLNAMVSRVRGAVKWRQHRAKKSNPDNQKHRRLFGNIVRSPWGVKLWSVGEVCLASEQVSPWRFVKICEDPWRFVQTLQSRIKNRLKLLLLKRNERADSNVWRLRPSADRPPTLCTSWPDRPTWRVS